MTSLGEVAARVAGDISCCQCVAPQLLHLVMGVGVGDGDLSLDLSLESREQMTQAQGGEHGA